MAAALCVWCNKVWRCSLAVMGVKPISQLNFSGSGLIYLQPECSEWFKIRCTTQNRTYPMLEKGFIMRHTHTIFSSVCCHGDMVTACTPVPVSWAQYHKANGSLFCIYSFFLLIYFVMKMKDVKALKLESICASRSRRISLTRPNICSQLLPAIYIPVNWWLRNFFAIESCCAQGYKHTRTHMRTHTLVVQVGNLGFAFSFCFFLGGFLCCVCARTLHCGFQTAAFKKKKKTTQCRVVFL